MAQTGPNTLELRAGEIVEVKQAWEIMATLDERGRLEELPFMPEMLAFCGKRYRVFKRADKTCDNIGSPWSIRRMRNAVHLEDGRCNGSGHDACEAGCLIFWKEAWLRRVDTATVSEEALRNSALASRNGFESAANRLVQISRTQNAQGQTVYSCQATELRNFTEEMASWDPFQYWRDLRSGNLAAECGAASRGRRHIEVALGIIELFRGLIIGCFNIIQRNRGGAQYPFVAGNLDKTRIEELNLQPGELVEVRSKEEIIATLDKNNRNRGLLFDSEMLRYCGGIYRVLRRVHRLIDEKTGLMLQTKYPCIVLEGVWCRSDYHRFCPRAIYSYWRENWLKRASAVPAPAGTEQESELSCEPCLTASSRK